MPAVGAGKWAVSTRVGVSAQRSMKPVRDMRESASFSQKRLDQWGAANCTG